MTQANVAWLYAIEEPAEDIFSIPSPPFPVAHHRNGRCSWSRRLVHAAVTLAAGGLLGAILALIGVVR